MRELIGCLYLNPPIDIFIFKMVSLCRFCMCRRDHKCAAWCLEKYESRFENVYFIYNLRG
jgi:hypothetical protein